MTKRRLGIDLGGASIKWVILAGREVVDRGDVATPKTGAPAVVDQIVAIAKAGGVVESVGIGVPGLYEADGSTTFLPNVPGEWKGIPLAHEVSTRVGVPTAVANDVRAFTLAEWWLGAGQGVQDLTTVAIGTGVGGGVVAGGRIQLGMRQRAGEIGHQCVDPGGLRCGCGSTGCVETLASGPAIMAAAVRVVLQGVETALRDKWDECGSSLLTVEAVAECARAGDDYAADIFDQAGRAIGHGMANVCTVLAPERIVVGGGVANAFDLLHPSIARTITDLARTPETPEIVRAKLGEQAGAIGAALWPSQTALGETVTSEEQHT